MYIHMRNVMLHIELIDFSFAHHVTEFLISPRHRVRFVITLYYLCSRSAWRRARVFTHRAETEACGGSLMPERAVPALSGDDSDETWNPVTLIRVNPNLTLIPAPSGACTAGLGESFALNTARARSHRRLLHSESFKHTTPGTSEERGLLLSLFLTPEVESWCSPTKIACSCCSQPLTGTTAGPGGPGG